MRLLAAVWLQGKAGHQALVVVGVKGAAAQGTVAQAVVEGTQARS